MSKDKIYVVAHTREQAEEFVSEHSAGNNMGFDLVFFNICDGNLKSLVDKTIYVLLTYHYHPSFMQRTNRYEIDTYLFKFADLKKLTVKRIKF